MKKPWLVPFKGRNKSLWYNQNFLWQQGSIYIMDNHRAAPWCWLREIDKDKKYNIFHIDNHYDTGAVDWNAKRLIIEDLNIEQYLNWESYTGARLLKHENYLAFFLKEYSFMVNKLYCTKPLHPENLIRPNFNNSVYIDRGDLPTQIDNINNANSQTILNIDLDYFFDDSSDSEIVSNAYVDTICKSIAEKYLQQKIQCITIALSPDYCGTDYVKGWKKAEQVCDILVKYLDINFRLP